MRRENMAVFMRFPQGRKKALTLSYDDGVEQDIRLLEIMNNSGLKGTFNLNSGIYKEEEKAYEQGDHYGRMTYERTTQVYAASGQEVALHGLTHPFLDQLPPNLATYEIVKDRENLEQQFQRLVRGMAYPYGAYSDSVVEALKAAGIIYARTTVTTGRFDLPTDWLRLSATCHHNYPGLMELSKKFIEEEPELNPVLFYLWGHSYEYDIDENWNIIEEFAAYIGNRDEIWYATNIEIHDYIEAFRSLEFSIAAGLVKNPTAQTVWFVCNQKEYQLESGEIITLT
jgi:peptidoglycan/xylan/chitin deacetylase (PgdA/CDA1 family)